MFRVEKQAECMVARQIDFPLKTEDALGRPVALDAPPTRIVSLVPSQSDLLAFLGLDEEVVGVTRYCEKPHDWRNRKSIVGGTKDVDIEAARALRPDLVLAGREENTPGDIAALAEITSVYVTDVRSLEGALSMISAVGDLVARHEPARELSRDIEHAFDSLRAGDPIEAACLVWRAPFMAAGGDTLIDDLMRLTGFTNVFSDRQRYPEVSIEELSRRDPKVLLLPDEPYPFSESDSSAADIRAALPDALPAFVSGRVICWYGPSLLDAPIHLTKARERHGTAPKGAS